MSLRAAAGRGAEVIVTAVTIPRGESIGVLAPAAVVADSVTFADGTTKTSFPFQAGYNPIGVRQVTYDNTGGNLWAIYV